MSSLILLLTVAFIASMTLSGLVLWFAPKLKLIDLPNERSSHTKPVPRGGGIAIASVFLLLLSFIPVEGILSLDIVYAMYASGALIACLGFIDDRNHIPAFIRLFFHFIAASWIIYCLYGNFLSESFEKDFWSTFIYATLPVLLLVWLLNLYNFMDGIDTLASNETITVSLGASFLSWYVAPNNPDWIILLLIAFVVSGFLIWNLPPAKLFMGDSGSAFLGIILGTLMINAKHLSDHLFYAWLILLGVYIVDASITLIRRLLAKEKFYQAHRTHAYQHAAILLKSHGKVSMAILFINTLWLFPIAIGVTFQLLFGPVALVIAYTPLIWLSIYLKAGVNQSN